MLIRELEQKTGLERATIRYYEKEGLITPHREENGYRTYSDADREVLLKIKLLRQLGMSLEKIRELQQGSADFSEALEEQISGMESLIDHAERSRQVCIRIREDVPSYETLDASYYLKLLEQPALVDQRWKPQQVPEFKQRVVAHPWKRYFARYIDSWFFVLVIEFLIVVVFRVRPFRDLVDFLNIFWIRYLLWIPVEAVLIHYFRTTPGKWLFGIRIESINGGPLDISNGMHRAWDVLRYGYGFNLPIYSYWRHYRSYKDYTDFGYAQWDYEWGAEYQFEYYYDAKRKIAMGLMIALFVVMSFTTLSDSVRPVNRGEDLTVAQFAENYNRMMDEDHDAGSTVNDVYLEDDGTWKSANSSGNVIVVNIGGEPVIVHENGSQEPGYSDFEYGLEDGYIRTVTYKQTWNDIWMLRPLSARATNMTMSIASAQDWFDIFHHYSLTDELESQSTLQSGSLTYENLEIRWSTSAENCRFDGSYYVRLDENVDTSVTLEFEIIIHPTK